jgi:hypothetical protein
MTRSDLYRAALIPAMRSQESAHRLHSSAHRCMVASSPIFSHESAQARHTSAQTPHVLVWKWEPRSMKLALA